MKKIKRTISIVILACSLVVSTFLPVSAQISSPVANADTKITAVSTFYGYNSLVNRPLTGGQPAYDYSVHLIKTGEDTGSRYRAFVGGRWKSSVGDGDHILQYSSPYGTAGSWSMWSEAPEFYQGQEEGKTNKWFSNNVMEPEVLPAPNGSWLMYVQVEIDPGQPIDIAGQTAAIQADRIMLMTSNDCKNWTRKEDRGVITNITTPTVTNFHHQEVVYVPWDSDSKPYWMYVAVNINGVFQGHFRIRSNDPTTFDWNTRENTSGIAQLGNQIGYMEEAPNGPLFVRITFTENNGRHVPALQYSKDGLVWGLCQVLEGPTPNTNNNNTYFLGLSTLNGTGKLEYLGNNKWKALYAATTCNTPVAPEIFNSEVGMGSLEITLDGTEDIPFSWDFNTNNNTEGWTSEYSTQSVADGSNSFTSTGTDPKLFSPDNLNFNAAAYKYIKIRMKNNSGNAISELFFTTTASTVFSADKCVKVINKISSDEYTEYVFDMSACSPWTGTIKQLRFDPIASTGSVDIDYIRVTEWGHPFNGYTHYWGFNTDGYVENWIPVNQLSQSVSGGINTLTTTGSDPYIYSPNNLSINSSSIKQVRLQIKNNTSSTNMQLYFRRSTDTNYSESRSITISISPNSNIYTEYVIDFGGNSSWTGTIDQFRLDPGTASGTVNVNYFMVVKN